MMVKIIVEQSLQSVCQLAKTNLSTRNRIQNSEQSLPQPLIFGAVFTNCKLVPNRVELLNILQKVQVVELIFITYLCNNFLPTRK